MENKKPRYTFGGYIFSTEKIFNLVVGVKNYNGEGTSTSVEIGLELTTEERMELIKVLLNAGEQESE
jgi:HKD family nuclease